MKNILKVGVAGLLALALSAGFYYRDSLIYRMNPYLEGETGRGVVFYDRWRTQEGFYNIVVHLGDVGCVVMDMNGKEIFRFSHTAQSCHFFQDGSIFFMSHDGQMQFYDSAGKFKWQADGFPHHDVDVNSDETEIFNLVDFFPNELTNKLVETYVIGYAKETGQPIFVWRVKDHLADLERILGYKIEAQPSHPGDKNIEVVHINSIQVLDRDMDMHPAFRKNNILVNCLKNRMSFIIDRETGQVIWHYRYDRPTFFSNMAPPFGAHSVKLLDNGNLFYFFNDASYSYSPMGFSAAVEDKAEPHENVWHYTTTPPQNFYSKQWGAAFKLNNGNALITNSAAGSAFEVTESGRVVWQWIMPENNTIGMALPVFKLYRVEKARVDRVIKTWRALQ